MTRYAMQFPSVMGNTTFENIFNEFWGDKGERLSRGVSGYPITDVFHEEDLDVIEIALAGFTKDSINVEVNGNQLIISSEGFEQDGGKTQRRVARRAFSRTFVDYKNKNDLENAKVSFVDGLLRVEIPPKNKTISKKIEIK